MDLARKPDDLVSAAVLGTALVPETLSITYTYTDSVDLLGYDSVVFFVRLSDKSTATTLLCTVQESDAVNGVFGWIPAEGSPAVVAPDATTSLGRYVMSYAGLDDAMFVVPFQIPIVHKSRYSRGLGDSYAKREVRGS